MSIHHMGDWRGRGAHSHWASLLTAFKWCQVSRGAAECLARPSLNGVDWRLDNNVFFY